MTHELILTSVAQGLNPKDHGFCPVAADAAVAPRIVQHLFALSHYRHFDSESEVSPVAYSHLILPGKIEHVLSRVADAGLDYQQKPNVLAHHIVLEGLEIVPESPAWLQALPGFHVSEWNEPPLQFTQGRSIPTLTNPQPLTRRQQIARQYRWLDPQKMALTGSVDTESETYRAAFQSNENQIVLAAPPTTPCPTWQELTGDAGWGGALADTVLTGQPVVVIYKPEQNILPLFVEALALLPSYVSWQTTFCTYFTGFPDTVPCQWKGVVAGSDEAKTLVRDINNLVLDLTIPMGEAPSGQYVDFARHGQEHMLPLDAEDDTAVLTDSDTKSFDEDTKKIEKETEISLNIPPVPLPGGKSDPALPTIQLPKKPPGLFETFLRRSSRFQFYFLYSIMLALTLLLFVLAVDQVGNFGIMRNLQNREQTVNPLPLDEDEPEIISELDEKDPVQIEPELTDAERTRKTFEEDREKQREPLLQFLEGFAVPDFLAIHFPDVYEGQIEPPVKATFDELKPLLPFAPALKLQFIPLFELPEVEVRTVLVLDALPDLVWRVDAVDTRTRLDVPMFLFQWTESGLEMDWHREGLGNQHLYDTILSSLGFLQLSVADEWESSMEIPLFAPMYAQPVRAADLVRLADTDSPEYVVELPFASELWRNVFAHHGHPGEVLLEIRAEPAEDVLAGIPLTESLTGTPLFDYQINFEVCTSQQAGVPEDGKTVYEDIMIPFVVWASLEEVVWREEAYEGRLRLELKELEAECAVLEEVLEQLPGQVFDFDRDNSVREKLEQQYKKNLDDVNFRIRSIAGILEKVSAAYEEVAQNESLRFYYWVFLTSADGKRKLLVLTTEI